MDEKIFDPVQLLLRANNATIASQAFRIVKLETDREEQQQMFLAASREISELQMLATNIERRAEEAETALAAMTAERDELRESQALELAETLQLMHLIGLRTSEDFGTLQATEAIAERFNAMTKERDSLEDAVHFLNTMNDEQDEWFTRIADDHGGWHEDLPTGEAHIEEIIGNLKKERDARDVAIRVLAKACANLSGLCNCESWCPARTDGKACTCGNEMEHAAIIQTINANPIARAATDAAGILKGAE